MATLGINTWCTYGTEATHGTEIRWSQFLYLFLIYQCQEGGRGLVKRELTTGQSETRFPVSDCQLQS